MPELTPSSGFATIEEEYEAKLRDAFVTHRADYVAIHSRRQRFQTESAEWALAKGWLSREWLEIDPQYGEFRYRLTPVGKQHFGLAHAPGDPDA